MVLLCLSLFPYSFASILTFFFFFHFYPFLLSLCFLFYSARFVSFISSSFPSVLAVSCFYFPSLFHSLSFILSLHFLILCNHFHSSFNLTFIFILSFFHKLNPHLIFILSFFSLSNLGLTFFILSLSCVLSPFFSHDPLVSLAGSVVPRRMYISKASYFIRTATDYGDGGDGCRVSPPSPPS